MMDLFSELFGMFDDFDSVFTSGAVPKEYKECPVCKHSWADFTRTGKFGCGECYKTFDGVLNVIRQTQQNSQHNGKIPSKSGAEVKMKRRLAELKKELKAAVDNEEYEKAAKLHSEIKEIEGGMSK